LKDSPRLLYQLAAVQCLVWVGITAWMFFGEQWFGNSVYGGDENAPDGSLEKIAYAEGQAAFALGGQLKSILQVVSALTIMWILQKTDVPPRLVYAPCIFIGFIANFLAAYAVTQPGNLAVMCMALSTMPETGSFAIPFGLVAVLNKRAEQEGKVVSTALQMALLNCCVTFGQQMCTMTLAAIETEMPLKEALPYVFMVGAATMALGLAITLFLDDRLEKPQDAYQALGDDGLKHRAALHAGA